MKKLFIYLIFIFFGLTFTQVLSQNITLNGIVTDSLNKPIPNTNLIAIPLDSIQNKSFTITNQQGNYTLKLKSGSKYLLEITHLGFSKIIDSIHFKNNSLKNYQLLENTQLLEQVIIKSEMAVIVKEDTITYRADQFKTGEDRKLEDLLKKLPGIEVTDEGNVLVNGKEVEKLMIDGKDFFGGDTKLGVKNIPVDVIDKIEALDNYSDIPFMKNLSDSDKMVLDIKLKKGKKQFIFGENKIGGGIKERYNIHPTYFYYSPKTTVNIIGNFNNTGNAPIDTDDLNRFRGQDLNNLNDPVYASEDGLEDLYNTADAQFRKTEFAAGNIDQEITKQLKLNAYSLFFKQKTETLNTNNITYFSQEELEEDRTKRSTQNTTGSLNKLRFRYKPNDHNFMSYNAFINFTKQSFKESIFTQVNDSVNQILTNNTPKNLSLKQFFRYNTQSSKKHTTEIRGNFIYKKRTTYNQWNLSNPNYLNLLPLETPNTGDPYSIVHDYSSINKTGRINLKHFWVLDYQHHFYPIAGLYFYNETYHSEDYQLINTNKNSFEEANFNNQTLYGLVDAYAGFQYKLRIKKLLFKSGLVYHYYFWNVTQFNQELIDKQKGILLPEFKTEYKFSFSRKINLNYKLLANFADAPQFANRLRLLSFNQLYKGNSTLENNLYHSLDVNYSNSNISHDLNYYLNFNYLRQEKSVRNSTILEGNNQITTSIYTDLPENSYNISGRVSKKWNDFRISINGKSRFSDYSRIINQEKINYSSQNYSYDIFGKTNLKYSPNFGLGFSHQLNKSNSESFSTEITTLNPYINLSYKFLKNFIWKASYSYTYYKNKTINQVNNFQNANSSLFYKKKKSPWGFELRAENIFDIKYINNNYFNEFIVYDQRNYIQERIILFILSYQL